jgi:two-component system, sensor histidine kinase PdtaS
MRLSKAAVETDFRRSARRAVVREKHVPRRHVRTTVQLKNALAREDALLREKSDLLQRHAMMAQEFEHRLLNSLQLIVSLLSLQSRAATAPEAATQLKIAANRVAALGRVHRQLHLLDHQEKVEFRQYIQHLCEDLSGLLFQEGAKHAIVLEGANVEIPTALGIPLGFIVNELITNSAKYAKGAITVRLATMSAGSHLLSVSDDGPGLPADFDPASGSGLGMKIVQSLVKQIGGELHIARADDGHGACFTVTFDCPVPSVSNSA